MPALPSGSCAQLFSPLISLKSLFCLGGRESVLWSGLFWAGREPCKPPGLAAEKRCIVGEGDLTEVEMGNAAWLGSFLTGSPWQAA